MDSGGWDINRIIEEYVERSKLTDTAFVNLGTEQLGLCVDVVYSLDDCECWDEYTLIYLEETYNQDYIAEARALAYGLAEALQIPVREDVQQ